MSLFQVATPDIAPCGQLLTAAKSAHALMVAREQGMRFWIDVPEPQLHVRQRMITDIGELSALDQKCKKQFLLS